MQTSRGKLQKVKLLNIVGRPVGVITHIYCDKGFSFQPHPLYDKPLYWVRLKDGTLLKDVTDSEIERLPAQPKQELNKEVI